MQPCGELCPQVGFCPLLHTFNAFSLLRGWWNVLCNSYFPTKNLSHMTWLVIPAFCLTVIFMMCRLCMHQQSSLYRGGGSDGSKGRGPSKLCSSGLGPFLASQCGQLVELHTIQHKKKFSFQSSFLGSSGQHSRQRSCFVNCCLWIKNPRCWGWRMAKRF